jgi:hypothetical protein
MTTTDYAPVNGSGPAVEFDADPTADWPIPFTLTPAAEAVIDAEAGS